MNLWKEGRTDRGRYYRLRKNPVLSDTDSGKRKPRSLKLCTLLDKPERRVKPVTVDYVGFNIPDEFVVGYGLDYDAKIQKSAIHRCCRRCGVERSSKGLNNRKNRGLSGLTLLVFVAVLFAALWFTNQIDQREKVITYQEFTQLAGGGDIDTVEVIQNKNVPTGRLEIAMKSDVEGAERKILYVSDVNEIQDLSAGK